MPLALRGFVRLDRPNDAGGSFPRSRIRVPLMINPTPSDIGREVVYFAKWRDELRPAYGEITGITNEVVLVAFGDNVIPIPHEELEWGRSGSPNLAAEDDEQVRDDLTLDLFVYSARSCFRVCDVGKTLGSSKR